MENVASYINLALLAVTAATLVIALLTYIRARRKTRIEKACELAKFYADNIIWKTNVIAQVCDVQNKNSIEKRRNLKFTLAEAKSIIEADGLFPGISDFQEAIYRNINLERLLPLLEIEKDLGLAYTLPTKTEFCNFSDDGKHNYIEVKRNPTEIMMYQQTATLISQLLNELEWFSMNFNYGIADSSIVYQSLHQTFLTNIQILYFHIADMNDKPSPDRFYTNIAKLYNDWMCRSDKNKALYRKAEEKGITHGKSY